MYGIKNGKYQCGEILRFFCGKAGKCGKLIAVVMGAPEPKGRFADAAAMLNYGFGICRFYEDKNEEPLEPVQVSRLVKETVGCEYARTFRYLDTIGQALAEIRKEIRLPEKAEAPVKKGDVLGKAVYLLNGTEIGSVDLIAAEDAPEAGEQIFWGKTWRELLLLGEGERVSYTCNPGREYTMIGEEKEGVCMKNFQLTTYSLRSPNQTAAGAVAVSFYQ